MDGRELEAGEELGEGPLKTLGVCPPAPSDWLLQNSRAQKCEKLG